MYAMKPLNENIKITTTTTRMYKCKNYYSEEVDASLPSIAAATQVRLYFEEKLLLQ